MNDMEKTLVSESEDFAAMLEETMIKTRPGQVVKGVVAQVSDDGVVVSIPGKADGYIKKNDLVTVDCKVEYALKFSYRVTCSGIVEAVWIWYLWNRWEVV